MNAGTQTLEAEAWLRTWSHPVLLSLSCPVCEMGVITKRLEDFNELVLLRRPLGSLEKGPELERLVCMLFSVVWPGPYVRLRPDHTDHKTIGRRRGIKSLTREKVGKNHSSTSLGGGSGLPTQKREASR